MEELVDHTETFSKFTLSSEGAIAKQAKNNSRFGLSSTVLFMLLGFYFLAMFLAELVTNYHSIQFYMSISPAQSTANRIIIESPLLTLLESSKMSIYLKLPLLSRFDFREQNQAYNQYGFGSQAETCEPQQKLNRQIHKTTNLLGGPLLAQGSAIPCGKYPALYLQSNFTVQDLDNSTTDIPVDFSDLSLSLSQVGPAYSAHNYLPTSQWADMDSTHFTQWLQPNAALSVTKLWGKISYNFSGRLKIAIQSSNPIPIDYMNLKILLDDNQSLGGHNIPLCLGNGVFSLSMFAFALIMYLLKKRQAKEDDSVNDSAMPQELAELWQLKTFVKKLHRNQGELQRSEKE